MYIKHIFVGFLFLLPTFLPVKGQTTPLVKYEIAPWNWEHVYLDLVQDNTSRVIDLGEGQYVGQMSNKHTLYGYGQFINNSGDVIVGKFRDGELMQGISLGKDNVTVGSRDFYCSYSLTTGEMQYIYKRGVRELMDTGNLRDYTFMSQTFQNGDRYIGEFYQGKRHGLGIYYYATGGLWFGSFSNDIRSGFGVWIKQDNDMVIGLWEGEDERRRIYVPTK